MAKIRQITVNGTTYELTDKAINDMMSDLLSMSLSTNNQSIPAENYWVPTTTDKTAWDNIKTMHIFNLKGAVASYSQLPQDAAVGDVYLIANATSGYTEEWVKTDTAWELLGTVSGSVDISGKEDKSQVKGLFDGFTATLITGSTDEYVLTIPQCDANGSIVTPSNNA